MPDRTSTPQTEHAQDEIARLGDWYDEHDAILDGDPAADEVDVVVAPDPTMVRSVRLRKSTLERLSSAAESRGMGITELIRTWVEERLDAEDEPEVRAERVDLLRTVVERLSTDLGLADVVSFTVLEGNAAVLQEERSATEQGVVRVPVTRALGTLPKKKSLGRSGSAKGVSNLNSRYVVPNAGGGWDVVKPGARRASSHHNTQQEAIDRGREIVQNAGGGELRIHSREGRIRDSDTIPPGKDSAPAKE